MSGSPFWWPAKQVCIKKPCTQDLSSLPTGIFRSFTASRSLSWHIYLSDFVKTWPLGFRLGFRPALGQSGAQKCGGFDVLVGIAG